MGKGWLDNYNDSKVSVPEGFEGEGYSTKGRNYSPAWGGQFQMGGYVYPVNYVPEAQMGASIPGAVGFTYARTNDPAPSNGPYAKKTKASAQKGKAIPKFNLDNFKKKQEINLREEPREIVRDNTRVVFRDEKGKRKEANPNKQISTNYDKRELERIRKEEEKQIVADRKARIADSMAAQKENYTSDNWRELLARETQATGDKFRLFPEEDSFIDNWLNPAVMIGNMASDLGQAPYYAEQSDSVLPYVTSIAVPLLTGGLEGIGAKTNRQFINNLANPVNIVPGYKSAEKYIGNKLGKESGLLSNSYKYNPWAFKPQKGKIYRQVGKPGFDDAIKEGKIYDKGQKEFLENNPDVDYLDQYNDFINTKGFDLRKPSPAPFFAKEELFFPINRKATGKGNKKTRFSDAEYLFEGDVPDEALLPRYRDAYLSPEQSGRTFVLRPEYNDLSNFNVYRRHWLQGYKQIPKQEDGGVIKDDLGQWAHPGEITEINSPYITMKGVPYPVLGISDTGDVQMMYPEEEYEFDGESVTEYPMAKNGIRQEQKGLVNLDNLLNFTNYNTKQPGGWLDKY